MRLRAKRVLITGGGSGIGLAIARCFEAEGAALCIAGRKRERLEAARAELGAQGVRCRPADVSDRDQVRELVEWAERELGGIDILVNNAGVNVPRRSLAKLSLDDWDRMIAINLNGAFYCVHAVLPGMRSRGSGLIINISSVAGVRIPEVAGAGYTAAKHGMSALSFFTGIEERDNGIRSSLICPGEVNTPILDDRPSPMPAEDRRRILQPEDVAAAVLFIATLPPRAVVPELVITPSNARFG